MMRNEWNCPVMPSEETDGGVSQLELCGGVSSKKIIMGAKSLSSAGAPTRRHAKADDLPRQEEMAAADSLYRRTEGLDSHHSESKCDASTQLGEGSRPYTLRCRSYPVKSPTTQTPLKVSGADHGD